MVSSSRRERALRFARGCLGWILLLAFVGAPAGADPGAAFARASRQVLVKVRGSDEPLSPRVQSAAPLPLPAGAREVERLPLPGWRVIEVPPDLAPRDAVAWLRRRPEVLVAEPNHGYELHTAADDPERGRLYGLDQIGAPAAWAYEVGDSNVVVAVLDTGIDPTHPDLAPNLWRNPRERPGNGFDDDGNGWVDDVHGVDVVDGDGDPTDDAGHGTHVAGTIGAAGNNGRGVVGVCRQVRVMAVRVGAVDGFASTSEIVRGFDYLVRARRGGVNVRVANCSWGGGPASAALKEAMAAAGAAGILIVCSAGNDGQDNDLLPAFPSGYDVPEILGVTASTACDLPWSAGNRGRATVDLGAPGAWVLSTYPRGGRYAVLSGTSMAAPHVAGAAALLWSLRPDLTVAQVRALLVSTVDRDAAWDGRVASGGRLNVGRAMERLAAGAVPVEEPPGVLDVQPGALRLGSPAPRGRWGDGPSGEPALSADGRWLAFRSAATNLVPGDTEGFDDVFVRDLRSDTVVRASRGPAGRGGEGDSHSPAVSADGRFVVFVSRAPDLGTVDGNGVEDVFLWDRLSGGVELVSVRSDGRAAGNGPSEMPAISADGTVVVFASTASDLVAGDRNGAEDVFVRDRVRRTTERVSLGARGVEALGWSDAPSISADGRFVVFESSAANLVGGDRNQAWDCFVRDRVAGTTERVSLTGAGGEADADSYFPVISGDGRWVAFASEADNLAGATPGERVGVFLRDRQGGHVLRVGMPPGGAAPADDGFPDALSADGRYLTFTSAEPRLAPGGAPGFFRAFGFDRLTGVTEELGLNAGGYTADDAVFLARPSADGRWVAFAAHASNLVPGDGNGQMDVFVLDRGGARADLAIRAVGQTRWIGEGIRRPRVPPAARSPIGRVATAGFEIRLTNAGEARAFRLSLSADTAAGWRIRAIDSPTGPDLGPALAGAGWVTPEIPAGSNRVLRLEIDRAGAASEAVLAVRIAVRAEGEGVGEGNGGLPELDAVGAVVEATLPPPGFVLISRDPDGTPADRNAEEARVSGDGRYTVFVSESDRLVAEGDTNFVRDVFLRDRDTGVVRRISDASPLHQANADSRGPSIAADGRRVAFESRATNLVPGDDNGVEDVFVRDLVSGGLRRVSESAAGRPANRGSDSAFLAAGGRFVAFTSAADNLVAGDDNGARDVFVKDLESGAVECASRSRVGVFGEAESGGGVLSADGRYVVFTSFAGNLVDRDGNAFADVYLLDRLTGEIELVSANAKGLAGNGPSGGGSVSDDGRWVTFYSYAGDLVPGAPFAEARGYLLDRAAPVRSPRPAAEIVGALPGGLELRRAAISPEARWFLVSGILPCGPEAIAQALVHDRLLGETRVVSARRDGAFGDRPSSPAALGVEGRFLVFESGASNLGEEPGSGAGQVYLADLARPGVEGLARRAPEGPWRKLGQPESGEASLVQLADAATPGSVAGGNPRRFAVRLTNAGSHEDRFRTVLTVDPPGGGAGLQVWAGSSPAWDITAPVQGAGWESPPLAPGASVELVFVVAADGRTTGDRELALRATSLSDAGRGFSVRLSVAADDDGDGLPDVWERRWFGSLEAASGSADADRDLATDREEWEAGTSPLDPGDRLRLEWVGPGELAWPTVSGVYYELERSGRPDDGFAAVGPEPVPGSGRPLRRTIPGGASASPSFFRVRADRP
jgi:subtilisin family serine protease/Tol biopolymer transport system component